MRAPFSNGLHAAIREKFWHVSEDHQGTPRIFFDSGAGSLVLKSAHAAIERASRLSSYGGGPFPDSQWVDQVVADARAAVADLLNAPSPEQLFTGESATALLRRLAEAILPGLPDRSRILISATDHNANVDPWRTMAASLSSKQFDVQLVRFDPKTGTVDLDHLESLADARVRVVAVSHASNVLGAENPLREIRHLLHRAAPEAWLIVDGVHFIPHGPVDVQAMGADAYVFSSYKIFAQRGLSWAYASDAILQLPHYKLAPAPERPPESWEWGFRNPADFAPIIEVVEYLAWLGRQCFPSPTAEIADRRQWVRLGQQAIRQYEHELVRAMLDGVDGTPGLRALEGVMLYGIREPEFYPVKEPTFSFNVAGYTSDEVATWLWQRHRIAVRGGDHYAVETHRQLGVRESVRASLAHYNTVEEVRAFLQALAEFLAERKRG
ncbi:MAG: aminotransferase class V-fold PLP-dependent enzyme [Blastocatellia bacterium]|nr:aminotransferase class V-fold PLP-dependent enzyme [Blastocatellia bacterium]MCS7157451.1 aminotransferase class V-fold PLP-dependent enzyme [Blastocatellia bacterium]MDW8168355.1 aminotransferase class V-fold PLP-dependent enzyme [Acidobacteriota bacterium]MDW8255551.1 aminotransferase class V-fold PLP-dependent enzyme [Acidobacteriota bacterium]